MERIIDKKIKTWIALMKIGANIGCHQMSERSFSYKGYQFPLCARCTGVVFGEVIAIISIICTLKIDLMYALLLVVPLVIDGGLQYVKILQSNNFRRVITGILAGFGLTYVYLYLIIFFIRILLKICIRN